MSMKKSKESESENHKNSCRFFPFFFSSAAAKKERGKTKASLWSPYVEFLSFAGGFFFLRGRDFGISFPRQQPLQPSCFPYIPTRPFSFSPLFLPRSLLFLSSLSLVLSFLSPCFSLFLTAVAAARARWLMVVVLKRRTFRRQHHYQKISPADNNNKTN